MRPGFRQAAHGVSQRERQLELWSLFGAAVVLQGLAGQHPRHGTYPVAREQQLRCVRRPVDWQLWRMSKRQMGAAWMYRASLGRRVECDPGTLFRLRPLAL